MKKKRIIIIIAVIAVLITVIAVVFSKKGSGKYNYETAVVRKQTIESTVTATGYVQPVDKVDVGTQVSGVIEKIYVDFNSHVKKGQLLAELDKSTLREKVTQAQASLNSAQSDLTYSQQNFDRVKQMYDAKAATQAAFEDASNKLAQAKTGLVNAKANLYQAQVNLSYAEIYSPIDGIVLNRAVEQGQTVAASFSTPTLFTIANNLKKMQVEADVDEADIGQVKLGQKVSFTVDSYIDDMFEGTVSQIRLQPVVTNNVVTYTVIIEAPNPDEKLYPGMTASVNIVTQGIEGLTVPAEALHFNPSTDMTKQKHARPSGNMQDKQGNAANHTIEKGVWINTPQGMVKTNIKTGVSDGVNTIVLSGLNEGDTVIVAASLAVKEKGGDKAATNPLMPKRPGGRR